MWGQEIQQGGHRYTCGYCGSYVASAASYARATERDDRILLCPACDGPTVLWGDHQIPGVRPGADVEHLPDTIASVYSQARDACAAGAFTGTILLARKLLMHVAVALGADERQTFVAYIDFLASEGHIPPKARNWVDHIRKRGNDETHEIRLADEDEATELLGFCEMLLRMVYDYPARIGAVEPPADTNA